MARTSCLPGVLADSVTARLYHRTKKSQKETGSLPLDYNASPIRQRASAHDFLGMKVLGGSTGTQHGDPCLLPGTHLLVPFYKPAELLPQTHAGARWLGLVTLEQITIALLTTVENPALGTCVMEVTEIRGAKV